MSRSNPFAAALLAVSLALPAMAQDGPSRQALSAAEYHVGQMEKAIERARGKEIDPKRYGAQAMKRVRDLKEQFPDDPKVEELFQRVRTAVKASRGDVFEITEEMLAYRGQSATIAETIGRLADDAWEKYSSAMRADARFLAAPFPVPEPGTEEADTAMVGREIILEDFRFPENEFTNTGEQFVYVGDRSQGMYFVQLDQTWTATYEAVKRFRDEVSGDLPQSWIVAGTIIGSDLLVPLAGEDKAVPAVFGWMIKPEVLYLPGRVLARTSASHPAGGTFVGEGQLASLKAPFLSARVIPDGIDPEGLIRIFATATKERNRGLFLDALDPALKQTDLGRERLEKFYEIGTRRFDDLYVHVEPVEISDIRAVRGEILETATDENFFLDDNDKTDIMSRADDLVEEIDVTVRAFDEKGKQEGPPRKVTLRRYGGERWYIYEGFPL